MTSEGHTVREIVISELRRNPLATVFTVIGGLAGAASLCVALAIPTTSISTGVTLGNLRLDYVTAILSCLGLSAFSASISRLVYKVSWVSGFFASIVFAAVNITFCIFILTSYNLGFPVFKPRADVTADLVYWATAIIFLAFNAERVGMDLARVGVGTKKPADDQDAWGAVGAIAVALIVWLGFVSQALKLISGMPTTASV